MKYREEITEFLQRIDKELTEANEDREGLTAENSRLKEENRRSLAFGSKARER